MGKNLFASIKSEVPIGLEAPAIMALVKTPNTD